MPLIKKVAWPWRDVTSLAPPQELPSSRSSLCVCERMLMYVLVWLSIFYAIMGVFLWRGKWQMEKEK